VCTCARVPAALLLGCSLCVSEYTALPTSVRWVLGARACEALKWLGCTQLGKGAHCTVWVGCWGMRGKGARLRPNRAQTGDATNKCNTFTGSLSAAGTAPCRCSPTHQSGPPASCGRPLRQSCQAVDCSRSHSRHQQHNRPRPVLATTALLVHPPSVELPWPAADQRHWPWC
jgi:hypothetical protein